MIVFRSERDGNNEVYVMGSDGSRQHNWSRDPHDDWGPAWSPAGLRPSPTRREVAPAVSN